MREIRRFFERDGKDFSFKALAEIRYAMAAETDRVADFHAKIETAKRGPRKPGKIDVGNWMLAGFFALPPAERDRIIAMGRRECERRQLSDRPIPFDAGGSGPVSGETAQKHRGLDHPDQGRDRGGRKPRKRG